MTKARKLDIEKTDPKTIDAVSIIEKPSKSKKKAAASKPKANAPKAAATYKSAAPQAASDHKDLIDAIQANNDQDINILPVEPNSPDANAEGETPPLTDSLSAIQNELNNLNGLTVGIISENAEAYIAHTTRLYGVTNISDFIETQTSFFANRFSVNSQQGNDLQEASKSIIDGLAQSATEVAENALQAGKAA